MADERAEQTLVEELRHARPDWGLLLEEGGEIEGNPAKPRWIVDPIDGTSNFLHGIPHFAISIAVQEPRPGGNGWGEISHGLVYHPLTDESFWAEKGTGRLAPGPAAARLLAPRAGRCADRDRHSLQGRMAIMTASTGSSMRSRPKWPASAASARPRSISPGSRPAAIDGFWEEDLQFWDIAAGIVAGARSGRLRDRFPWLGREHSPRARFSPATTRSIRGSTSSSPARCAADAVVRRRRTCAGPDRSLRRQLARRRR